MMTSRGSDNYRLRDIGHESSTAQLLVHSASQATSEIEAPTQSAPHPYGAYPGISSKKRHKPQQAIVIWSLGMVTVIVVNTTLIGLALRSPDRASLIVKLQEGSCAKAERTNSWVHLVVNLLSTIILSGSNYCMQYLVAPTRVQINTAHEKGEWLDIGIPSWRNLISMSRRRRVTWWALGLSSVPIHLLVNSVFFVSLSTNGYNVLVATEAFLQGAPFDNAYLPLNDTSWDGWTPNSRLWQHSDVSWQQYVGRLRHDGKSYPHYSESMMLFDPRQFQQKLMSSTSFEVLDKRSCILAYSVDLMTNRRNLVLVSTNSSTSRSSILYGGSSQYFSIADPEPETGRDYNPYSWICSDLRIQTHPMTTERADQNCFNYAKEIATHSSDWSPWMYDIERCLSEKVLENCSFSLNLSILVVVLICNIIKLCCMLSLACKDSDDHILTLGDGIKSFLEEPDLARGCLRFTHYPGSTAISGWITDNSGIEFKYLASARMRRRHLAFKRQWNIFYTLSTISIVGGCICLGLAPYGTSSLQAIWSLGLGKVNVQSVITGGGWLLDRLSGTSHSTVAIVAAVLVANIPQIVLSAIYLVLNNICSTIACGREWNRLSITAKGLRVSSTPRGEQRDSYFLSLPYSISLPIMMSTVLLHWLISQSIFLVVIAVHDPNGTLKNPIATATCGFSIMGIIIALVVSSIGFAAVVLYSHQKIRHNMPLVHTNSSGIAAACRVPRHHRSVLSTELVSWTSYDGTYFGPINLE